MLFVKEFLGRMEGETIKDEIIDNNRWSIIHERIFKWEGKFYKTTYSVGATEIQDECPYEHDEALIECPEVEPVPEVIIVYKEIKTPLTKLF